MAFMTQEEKDAAKKSSTILYTSYGLTAAQHLLAKNSALSEIAKYSNMALKAWSLLSKVQKIRKPVRKGIVDGMIKDTTNAPGTAITKGLNTATVAEKKTTATVIKEMTTKIAAAAKKARAYTLPKFPT